MNWHKKSRAEVSGGVFLQLMQAYPFLDEKRGIVKEENSNSQQYFYRQEIDWSMKKFKETKSRS